ncbi:MAG: hypothetical protein HOD92_04980 [Deltaproteobacteria bacterium]|jgi:hypothetical protein|nr:hypothetical protein [Deltaproteobacteria bacterium]MBT4527749.1 hypothetical protein [Deltaproteobacteria bacterium]
MGVKKIKEEKKRISLFDIINDETLHARAETNDEVVMALTEVVTKGDELPPVVVFYDGEHYRLADGFYRYEAHILGGRGTIPAIIFSGGRKEALFHALKSNVNHGLRRTNADKEKAVTIALTDPDIQGMSDNQIAKICKVSQPYVSKIRGVLTYNGYKFKPTRVCSDGRIINVSSIGQKKKTVTDPIEPEPPVVEDNNDEVVGPADQEGQENGGNLEPGSEDNVDKDSTDGDSGDEDIVEDDSETGGSEDDNEDNLDTDDTTDPEITGDDSETNLELEADDQEESGAGENDTDLDDETDEDTDSEIKTETGEEVTVANDFGNDDLEVINDPEILKSMIGQLRCDNKEQDYKIVDLEEYVVDLEKEVEKLEKDVEYLEKQLQARAKMESDASAALAINEMDKDYSSVEA